MVAFKELVPWVKRPLVTVPPMASVSRSELVIAAAKAGQSVQPSLLTGRCPWIPSMRSTPPHSSLTCRIWTRYISDRPIPCSLGTAFPRTEPSGFAEWLVAFWCRTHCMDHAHRYPGFNISRWRSNSASCRNMVVCRKVRGMDSTYSEEIPRYPDFRPSWRTAGLPTIPFGIDFRKHDERWKLVPTC